MAENEKTNKPNIVEWFLLKYDLKQREVATLIGLSVRHVQRLINNETEINLRTRLSIEAIGMQITLGYETIKTLLEKAEKQK